MARTLLTLILIVGALQSWSAELAKPVTSRSTCNKILSFLSRLLPAKREGTLKRRGFSVITVPAQESPLAAEMADRVEADLQAYSRMGFPRPPKFTLILALQPNSLVVPAHNGRYAPLSKGPFVYPQPDLREVIEDGYDEIHIPTVAALFPMYNEFASFSRHPVVTAHVAAHLTERAFLLDKKTDWAKISSWCETRAYLLTYLRTGKTRTPSLYTGHFSTDSDIASPQLTNLWDIVDHHFDPHLLGQLYAHILFRLEKRIRRDKLIELIQQMDKNLSAATPAKTPFRVMISEEVQYKPILSDQPLDTLTEQMRLNSLQWMRIQRAEYESVTVAQLIEAARGIGVSSEDVGSMIKAFTDAGFIVTRVGR